MKDDEEAVSLLRRPVSDRRRTVWTDRDSLAEIYALVYGIDRRYRTDGFISYFPENQCLQSANQMPCRLYGDYVD